MTGSPSPQAGLGHPVDRLGELPHHLGVFGVAEVQTVHDGLGGRSDAGQVGHALGHRQGGAGARIERAPARVGVGRQRDAALGHRQTRSGEAQQRGVAARPDDGIQEELRVVLAIDPRRVDQKVQQVVVRRTDRFVVGWIVGDDGVEVHWSRHRSVVQRCLVGQRTRRHLGEDLTVEALAHAQHADGATVRRRATVPRRGRRSSREPPTWRTAPPPPPSSRA